jgi:hypothetical protein
MQDETVRRCLECGKPLLGKRRKYCDRLCTKRASYKRHRERILREAHRWYRPAKRTPEFVRKQAAQHKVAYAVQKGDLAREPCLFCDDPSVDAHHHDYDQPLAVTWLCRTHHRRVHESMERLLNASTTG